VPQPRCGLCGAPTAWPVSRCRECAGRRLAFASARAATLYSGPARHLLAAWKERGLRRAAPLAAEVVAERLAPAAADVVTHVPADRARQLERGRHPAEELAARLAAVWKLEHATLLERRSGARRQTTLRRIDRGTIVRGAFAARLSAPPRVLLVDDVYTTGATVSAAAAALHAAGARTIEVVTFARTVR
jgi:predicted amidophosphoribosyltransferase